MEFRWKCFSNKKVSWKFSTKFFIGKAFLMEFLLKISNGIPLEIDFLRNYFQRNFPWAMLFQRKFRWKFSTKFHLKRISNKISVGNFQRNSIRNYFPTEIPMELLWDSQQIMHFFQ
ncbi:Uncharacterized protein TCM_023758 [Theobroma cacao]|uniref:Uncharacterized protein n=1 Tax=Theobroma cacao TaxID=3641 RepID=A0A061EUH2_THECC|nr:Uncharacterized protein TCM_023758 [Theobroma cacao]